MKYSLSDILKSTVLTEGRKEDAMNKYGASQELVDSLSAGDPSGNNKYLMWMTKQATGDNGKITNIPMADTVINIVQRFHSQAQRLNSEMAHEVGINPKAINNPKDINTYEDIDELDAILTVVEKKATDKEIRKESKKIFDDENILVIVPLTTRASCKYGAGTRWCITSPGNTHFDSYTKDAGFYFITDKNSSQSKDDRHYKYALQYYYGGRKTWWDARDDSHSETPAFMTTPSGRRAMKVIDDHQKKIAGDILKAKIESFKKNPNIHDYSSMESHLNEFEVVSVIKKLVEKEGYTFRVFNTVKHRLNTDEYENFIINFKNLSSNDFNSIRESLSNKQIVSIISKNPSVLNSITQTKWLDKKLDQSEKNNLSKDIKINEINNTESKVLMKKWSMTPEELTKHNSVSQYAILTQNGKLVKVVEVDSLNPESYRVVNSLKLRSTMDKTFSLYAIKTEKDLLNQYLNSESTMTDEELEKILSKAVKIG